MTNATDKVSQPPGKPPLMLRMVMWGFDYLGVLLALLLACLQATLATLIIYVGWIITAAAMISSTSLVLGAPSGDSRMALVERLREFNYHEAIQPKPFLLLYCALALFMLFAGPLRQKRFRKFLGINHEDE